MALQETEYGGQDTDRTQGIQPLQPNDALHAHEELRLLYATDPADEESLPDRYAAPVYFRPGFERGDR